MPQFRPLTPDDARALADLRALVTAVDGVEAFTEFKTIDLSLGRGHTMVAGGAGGLIAAGHAAWHHGDGAAGPHWAIELSVHPDHRTGEVWAATLRGVVGALPAEDRHVVWARSLEFEAVAAALGYRPVRRLSTLERGLPINEPIDLPDGVRLAPFVRGRDEAAWLDTNNAAFRGHPENGGITPDELAIRMDLDWFRSEDVLMAWSGDHLAGSCWTKRHPGAVGEIYIVGVHPHHQGLGLGKALVVAGLTHLSSAAHAKTGMLYVDHRSHGALALYESLGFRPVRITTMYEPRLLGVVGE